MAEVQGFQFEVIDAATASLIAQLQLDDLESLICSGKGKSRDGDISDADFARNLYRNDLNAAIALASDRRMTESIALAVQLDGPNISSELEREDLAGRDHSLAQELSGCSKCPPADVFRHTNYLDEEMLAKLAAIYVAPFEDDPPEGAIGVAEPSARGALRTPRQISRRCEVCRDQHKFFDVARLACGHEYCRSCIQQLFSHSLIDESLLPLRCCRQRIEPATVQLFVPSELIKEVERKRIEVETPNRTYCHIPHCSEFVPTNNIHNDHATCPRCSNITCITCKGAAHGGDCPLDTGLQQTLDLAVEQDWQRCPHCWTVVELSQGCYHITYVLFWKEDLWLTIQVSLRRTILLSLCGALENVRLRTMGRCAASSSGCTTHQSGPRGH